MATSRRPSGGKGTTRRQFIRYGSVSLLGVGVAGRFLSRARGDDVGPLSDVIRPCFDESPVGPAFTNDPRRRLPIPPFIGEPLARNQGDVVVQRISMTEQRGQHEFIPGISTPVWGYFSPEAISASPNAPVNPNDPVPGPTVFARRQRVAGSPPEGAQPTDISFTNQLPPNEERRAIVLHPELDPTDEDHPFLSSSTVVHLHGINGDMVSDGYPEDRREQGGTQEHHYPNNDYQRPATLWYHDHSVHITSLHVYRGLAGFYYVTDPFEDATGLPGTRRADPDRGYGFFDIPLLIKDVMILPEERDGRPRGTLVYDNCSHMGAYGDVMTVNAKQQPFFEVANRRYRFRTLNGSDARQYKIAIRRIENLRSGPNEPFHIIGTDHGLLFTPAQLTDFFHTTPSERWEFVFDFAPYPIGQRLVMVNLLADPDDRKLFPLMSFDVTRAEVDTSTIPEGVLRPPEHPADTQPPNARRFFLFDRQGGYFSINSKQWDPARVDAFPQQNSTEDWILETESGGWGHPVHLHLGRFQVMDVRGREPRPGELQGFKDTVWVGPNQRITVRHQFWNFSGRYVFHCHNGSHEDHDMMSQFQVQTPPLITLPPQ
jgi:spore coat protein A